VNPFVEGGPSFRPPEEYLATHGVTAGAGVEMHWHVLHIAPEFRQTCWGAENSYAPGYTAPGYARNEAVFLVGVSFGGPPYAARRSRASLETKA
jgi:hypothetical protein